MLQAQLRKFRALALSFVPLVLQFKVAKQNQVANLDDFSERIDRDEDADVILGYDEETLLIYSEVINHLLNDLVDYGYFDEQEQRN